MEKITHLINKYVDFVAYLFIFLFIAGAIALNLNRYWQYESGYYDLGIFDTAIWKVAHFQAPIIDHLVLAGKWIWADHFHPSIFLFAPIYWLTDKTEVLLIAQDIVVGMSGLVLYFIGKKLLKNKFLAFSVLTAYFLFQGLQNAVLFDFHEVTVMTLFLMLTYWAFFNNKRRLFLLFFIITLGFKESLFLLGIGLSIFLYLTNKSWRKIAVVLFFISILWGFVAIIIIIPYFSNGQYIYSLNTSKGVIELITRLFYPYIKVRTVLLSFLSFGFFPLAAPQLFPIIILHYASRFVNPAGERWDLGLHYNAEIAPTLAVATIIGIKYLLKNRKQLRLLFVLWIMGISLLLYRFVLHGPFGLTYNPIFYQHTKVFSFLDKMVAVVPNNTSVTAPNNLVTRFTHQESYILRPLFNQKQTDYVLFDLRKGQNPYSLYMGEESLYKTFELVKNNTSYDLIYHQGDQYVFKKRE